MSYEDHLIEESEREREQQASLPIGKLVVTGVLSAVAVYAYISMHASTPAASTSTSTQQTQQPASTSSSTAAAAAASTDKPKDETPSPWSATGHWADRSVVWPKHDYTPSPEAQAREALRQKESPLYPFARQSETNAGNDQTANVADDVPVQRSDSSVIVSQPHRTSINRCCIYGWYRREHPGECPSHPPPW